MGRDVDKIVAVGVTDVLLMLVVESLSLILANIHTLEAQHVSPSSTAAATPHAFGATTTSTASHATPSVSHPQAVGVAAAEKPINTHQTSADSHSAPVSTLPASIPHQRVQTLGDHHHATTGSTGTGSVGSHDK